MRRTLWALKKRTATPSQARILAGFAGRGQNRPVPVYAPPTGSAGAPEDDNWSITRGQRSQNGWQQKGPGMNRGPLI